MKIMAQIAIIVLSVSLMTGCPKKCEYSNAHKLLQIRRDLLDQEFTDHMKDMMKGDVTMEEHIVFLYSYDLKQTMIRHEKFMLEMNEW